MKFWILCLLIVSAFALENNSSTTPATSAFIDRSSCKGDAQKFCSDQVGRHHKLFNCLNEHLADLTPDCNAWIQQKIAGRAACGPDVEKLCPDSWGYRSAKRCVLAHYSQVSSNCQKYVEDRLASIPADACDQDMATFCSEVTTPSMLITCLKNHFQNISRACQKLYFSPTLSNLQNGVNIFEGHGDHHGHGHGRHGHGDGENKWGRHGSDGHGRRGHWKKIREHFREAKAACGQDVRAFCQAEMQQHDRRAIRDCLNLHLSEISSTCSTFLANSADMMDEEDDETSYYHGTMHRHKHAFKLAILILLVILALCAIRKCCKRRRLRMLMQLSQQQQQQGRLIPMVPIPSAPQPNNNQTVIYAASPYTGGSPVTAQPMVYNPV